MIQVPEDGWGAETLDLPGSLLGGATPPERSVTVPDWDRSGDDRATDPVTHADSAREHAEAVFRRQRSIGTFNRELDTLFTSIAEAPDGSDGLERFDRKVEELRQRHGGDLHDTDDREAFTRHAGEFAAMQRIGLKRALVERQASDALTQLADQLAYYAGKAGSAESGVFRQIATDSGVRAIDELREAGYLTAEAAETRKTAFLGQVDNGDVETSPEHNVQDTELSTHFDPQPRENTRIQHDDLLGVGVGDGEIPELKPVKELTDEQIEQLEKGLDALLMAASLSPPGRYAGAARDAYAAIRALIRGRSKTDQADKTPHSSGRPELPTGGIRHIDPAENLATGRYATDKVLRDHGEVENAMYRADVGAITFRYGTPGTPAKKYVDGHGLSHIIARRNLEGADGELFVRETLPDVLAHGRLARLYGPPEGRRADVEFSGNRVVLSHFRRGKRETWVLTGFERID